MTTRKLYIIQAEYNDFEGNWHRIIAGHLNQYTALDHLKHLNNELNKQLSLPTSAAKETREGMRSIDPEYNFDVHQYILTETWLSDYE